MAATQEDLLRKQVNKAQQPFHNQILEGKVKSYNEQKGFGFIECDLVFRQFKRDVFLHKKQAVGLKAGDFINFEVELNEKGNPQARNVNKVLPVMHGLLKDDIEDAWAAMEAEQNGNAPDASVQDAVADAWAQAESEEDAVADAWAQAEEAERQAKEAAQTQAKPKQSSSEVDAEADFLGMNPALLRGAKEAENNKNFLEEQLASPEVLADPKEYAKKSTMLARFASIVNDFGRATCCRSRGFGRPGSGISVLSWR